MPARAATGDYGLSPPRLEWHWLAGGHTDCKMRAASQKNSLVLLLGGLLLGLLLLNVLGEEGLVLLLGVLGGGEAGRLVLLDGTLAAETLLSHQALNLGGLVEGLVLALDLAADDVLAHVVLLSVEGEGLHNVVSSLDTESVWSLDVSDAWQLLVTLLDDAQEDGSDVGADDAAADGLAGALTNTGWDVAGSAYLQNVRLLVIIKYCDWRALRRRDTHGDWKNTYAS